MNKTQNPYVGPRTFQTEERHLFFGRDRESRDLSALVLSERLVLFYAQSGAGKSSLINTRLIPELEGKLYEVFPVARVSGEVPIGFTPENIYIYNLMRSLIRRDMDLRNLAGLSFSQFLDKLNEDEDGYFFDASLNAPIRTNPEIIPWPHVLIIDQFEELFSTNMAAWEKREYFFRQLTQTMEADPHLAVVLVMREDYIAHLDPYAHLVPNGLRVHYYMQRLGREAAIKAVRGPVEKLRPFASGVAESLIDNLASIKVHKPGGEQGVQAGQYVEPVQLQVVCHNLWENLPPTGTQITSQDLLEVGDISQSLERYFDQRVGAVANKNDVPERLIRKWFESELITSSGTRNMVLRDQKPTSGLRDEVIQTLQGDLVRAEMRAGQTWYELSHDRLIEPIITSNAKWFEGHLSSFQRRVVLWGEQGKSESLLLSDGELTEAEKEASMLALTADEQAFLDECRTFQKRLQRDRAQRRLIFAALIVSMVLLVFSVFATRNAQALREEALQQKSVAEQAKAAAEQEKIKAENAQLEAENAQAEAERQKLRAQEQAEQALAGSLAAQANSLKNSDHTLALLLGVEAYDRKPNDLLTKTTLFDLLEFTPYRTIGNFGGNVNSVAISPDGNMIAVGSCIRVNCINQGEIRLYDKDLNLVAIVPDIPESYGIINSLAFYQYPEMLILAAGGCRLEGCTESGGQVWLWKMLGTKTELVGEDPRYAHANLIKSVRFSPDGRFLALGSYDTNVSFLDLSDPGNPKILEEVVLRHSSFVNDMTFSPDGNYLVSAGDDQAIYVWDIEQKANILQTDKEVMGFGDSVTSVAFSPDGKLLASAGYDNLVRLWHLNAGKLSLVKELPGHTGYITTLAFNHDGTQLASAGFDSQIILWDVNTGKQNGPALKGHTRAINQLAFGLMNSDKSATPKPYLISVSNDRTVILWDLYTRNPVSPYSEYSDPDNEDIFAKLDWKLKACEAVHSRRLTEDEWNAYIRLDNTQSFENDYHGTCP